MIYLRHLSIAPKCISFWGCYSAVHYNPHSLKQKIQLTVQEAEFWIKVLQTHAPYETYGDRIPPCPFWAPRLSNLWHSLACSPIAPVCLHHHLVSSCVSTMSPQVTFPSGHQLHCRVPLDSVRTLLYNLLPKQSHSEVPDVRTSAEFLTGRSDAIQFMTPKCYFSQFSCTMAESN